MYVSSLLIVLIVLQNYCLASIQQDIFGECKGKGCLWTSRIFKLITLCGWCLFQVKSKVGRALEELGKKDPRYNSVNWDDAQKILQFCLMPYRVSRDAGHKAIHLYLFVKTLPLNRFISLFIRLFFRGIYNFEDVFLPQCQLRRPTILMSIKFCEFGKLSLC